MDKSTANIVAEQILKDATERQARKVCRTARWTIIVERLQTGLSALVFAVVGYTNAQRFLHDPLALGVVGTVCGLVAAAIIPLRWRSSLTVRRSGRP